MVLCCSHIISFALRNGEGKFLMQLSMKGEIKCWHNYLCAKEGWKCTLCKPRRAAQLKGTGAQFCGRRFNPALKDTALDIWPETLHTVCTAPPSPDTYKRTCLPHIYHRTCSPLVPFTPGHLCRLMLMKYIKKNCFFIHEKLLHIKA